MTWFEEMFDERYVAFYDELVDRTVPEADVAFLERALSLDAGARVLDLGCGFGRHSVALALRGHHVTGLDLSAPLLRMAKELAASAGVELELVHGDMRHLGGLGPFDAVICLYTVFGYFEDAENHAVLRGVHAALRPGGQLVLDVSNPLALMRHWPGRTWRESPTGVRLEAERYDALTGRVHSTRKLLRSDGTRVELPDSSVRLYPPHELARLLEACGFEIDQTFGALAEQPLVWDRSPRQVWIATRPA